MRVVVQEPCPVVADAADPVLDQVSPERLRATVEALSYPRHYLAQRAENQRARDWLVEELEGLPFDVSVQGPFDNVVAWPRGVGTEPVVLLGAHYDSVPETPGADDNASAITVCLEVARVFASAAAPPFAVVVFNREEDGLLGSQDFVSALATHPTRRVAEAHILEMVGYFTKAAGSQSKPAGLPIALPDIGDFVGILSNAGSNRIAGQVLDCARQVPSTTPILSLRTYLGVEKAVGDLLRSDHTPFWNAGIPALMWTDTSNFRNPHYHRPSDTPATLDYRAMADVARFLLAYLLRQHPDER